MDGRVTSRCQSSVSVWFQIVFNHMTRRKAGEGAGRSSQQERGQARKGTTTRGCLFHAIRMMQVYVSSAVRTRQTAEIVTAGLYDPANIEASEDLLELGQGSWETQDRKQVYTPAVMKEINSNNWRVRPPGKSPIDGLRLVSLFVRFFILTLRAVVNHNETSSCVSHSLLRRKSSLSSGPLSKNHVRLPPILIADQCCRSGGVPCVAGE